MIWLIITAMSLAAWYVLLIKMTPQRANITQVVIFSLVTTLILTSTIVGPTINLSTVIDRPWIPSAAFVGVLFFLQQLLFITQANKFKKDAVFAFLSLTVLGILISTPLQTLLFITSIIACAFSGLFYLHKSASKIGIRNLFLPALSIIALTGAYYFSLSKTILNFTINDPLLLVLCTVIFAFFTSMAYVLLTGQLKIKPESVVAGLALGIPQFGMLAGLTLCLSASTHFPTAFIQLFALSFMLTSISSVLILKRKHSIWQWFAIALSLITFVLTLTFY